MATDKNLLKVIALTAMVIALASVIQSSLAFLNYYQWSALPSMVIRTLLQLMLWASLFVMFYAVWLYFKKL